MTLFTPIRMVIPELAVAKARAKRNAYGFAYIPQKTKNFENRLRWHWKASGNQMIPKVPTSLVIGCFLPRPKSAKKTVFMPITRPDIDNFSKSILDSLTGFAWADDNQITDLNIFKRYTLDAPKITIVIEPVVYGGAA